MLLSLFNFWFFFLRICRFLALNDRFLASCHNVHPYTPRAVNWSALTLSGRLRSNTFLLIPVIVFLAEITSESGSCSLPGGFFWWGRLRDEPRGGVQPWVRGPCARTCTRANTKLTATLRSTLQLESLPSSLVGPLDWTNKQRGAYTEACSYTTWDQCLCDFGC